ncbi:MAG: serine hydrolase domain-containing protein [bacterium]
MKTMYVRFVNVMTILFIFMSMPMLAQEKEKIVEKIFAEYKGDKPGVSAAVFHNGKIVFTYVSGLADLEKGTLITPETNFRLASFSKQFTAMCVMILKEEGKLNYTDNLCDFFPDFPAYGKKITVKNLFNHTSGLLDYEDLLTDTAYQVLDSDVLEIMKGVDSTYFETGTQFRYSNTAYALLAMIVEKVSGKKFSQFMKEKVLDPLEMNNSVEFREGENQVPNRAYGYAQKDNTFVFSDQSTTSAVWGDGGLYSSTVDIFKWDQALYTEKLIKKETLMEAYTPTVLSTRENTGYGYGWYIDVYKGLKRVYHTGDTCGFRTIFQRYPEKNFSVVVLVNRREPEMIQYANQLTDLFLLD